jgi:DNA polymerase III alpha subunit (gram-positive type)
MAASLTHPTVAEELVHVYYAQCPACEFWELWDADDPAVMDGFRVPFQSCCPVCGKPYTVEQREIGLVSLQQREKGYSSVHPR